MADERAKEANMRRQISGIRIVTMITVLVGAGTMLCTATAPGLPARIHEIYGSGIRLDKEKKGKLDARKFAQSNLSASRFARK